MNSFLQSLPLLYFLFITALVHLGYFLLLKDTRSIFLFCLVSIFVYLVIPNMIVVLGVTLLFVDLLYIVNKSYPSQEGFRGTVTIKDASGTDIPADEFIENAFKTMHPNNKKAKDSVKASAKVEESEDEDVGNTLEEVDTQSKKMNTMIDKIKSVSPEMVDSLKMLHSIDIVELNKLINNMNKIATTLKE